MPAYKRCRKGESPGPRPFLVSRDHGKGSCSDSSDAIATRGYYTDDYTGANHVAKDVPGYFAKGGRVQKSSPSSHRGTIMIPSRIRPPRPTAALSLARVRQNDAVHAAGPDIVLPGAALFKTRFQIWASIPPQNEWFLVTAGWYRDDATARATIVPLPGHVYAVMRVTMTWEGFVDI